MRKKVTMEQYFKLLMDKTSPRRGNPAPMFFAHENSWQLNIDTPKTPFKIGDLIEFEYHIFQVRKPKFLERLNKSLKGAIFIKTVGSKYEHLVFSDKYGFTIKPLSLKNLQWPL